MNTIKDRIEYIRKIEGLSYNDLANLIGGITGDGLRKAIARGSQKDQFYANRVASKLGYNVQWAVEGKGEVKPLSNEVKISDENPILYIEKGGVKIHVDEWVDHMEEHFEVLMKNSNKYKLFINDKRNSLMYEFFKEHGIEVKVTTKEPE